MGRVEKLIEGKDGCVREAAVRKITAKQGRPTILRRPVQKLYPIEQSVGQEDCERDQQGKSEKLINTTPDESAADDEGASASAKRTAARRAEENRQRLIKDGRL